jgi:predicted TIM-barrel fold metal-dependent hydrolase
MLNILQNLKDKAEKEQGKTRSPHWPAVRALHLKNHPICEVCGGTSKLEVHHIKPFHLHPELELDPRNLISLCEGNKQLNCHLVIGHSGSFKKENPDVVADASALNAKLKGDGSATKNTRTSSKRKANPK